MKNSVDFLRDVPLRIKKCEKIIKYFIKIIILLLLLLLFYYFFLLLY